MTITFDDAVPVKVKGGGRKAAENPFLNIVQSIAHKTKKVNGEDVAVAKSAVFTHEGTDESYKTATGRIGRQLSDAGAKATPPCSVSKNFTPKSKTEFVVTFWTGPVIKRERKTKDENTKA